jgi:hypothetical protein
VSATFGAGDLCLLLDPRGRRYLIEIKPGQTFQYHGGYLRHEALIGLVPGTIALSSSGGRIAVMRPRLADYILKMRRGAGVSQTSPDHPLGRHPRRRSRSRGRRFCASLWGQQGGGESGGS